MAKRCLKLAMRISLSDDYIKALMRYLDEFEHQLSGLTLEFDLTNVKQKVVADKSKKVLSSHFVWGKVRPPMERKVSIVKKVVNKIRKKQVHILLSDKWKRLMLVVMIKFGYVFEHASDIFVNKCLWDY